MWSACGLSHLTWQTLTITTSPRTTSNRRAAATASSLRLKLLPPLLGAKVLPVPTLVVPRPSAPVPAVSSLPFVFPCLPS
jgi:hypothetical protein